MKDRFIMLDSLAPLLKAALVFAWGESRKTGVEDRH